MITLYDAPRCPYCARVRIVLAEKGVEPDVVEIDLSDRPAWIYEKNATGRVPVLEEEDGRPLPESAVIMEFLEERYPDPPLLPADPADRGFVRLLIFRDHELTDPYYALRASLAKPATRGDKTARLRRAGAFRRGEEGAAEQLDIALGVLDLALAEHSFLGGAEYGLADIAYVPWILRARDMLGVGLTPYPSLSAWLARLEERPAIAREVDIVAAL